MCRDILYIIIRDIESNQMGIRIIALLTEAQIQELSVVFIDNTGFFIAGKNFKENIWQIMNKYTKYYMVIGRKIQYNKIKNYC